MIVNKFCHGNVLNACFRVGTAEDAEISLYLLVESFHFSIGLRVIGCGC